MATRAETTSAASLPEIDIFSAEYARDPHAVLGPVQAEHTIARSQRGFEVLTYRGCQQLLKDTRFWHGLEEAFMASGIDEGPAFDAVTKSTVNAEGELHSRLRRVLAPYFAPARIESLRELAHRLVREWLDEVAVRGECDYVACVGRRLPAALFCAMIGVPLSEAEYVSELSDGLLKIFQYNPRYREEIETAGAQMDVYVRDLIALRRKEPGDDLVSMLLQAEGRGDISAREIVYEVTTLLAGSTDTTNAQLCQNMVALAEHPDQWQVLKDEPEHVPSAAQELTRYSPGVWVSARFARDGGDFGGIELPPGSAIWANVVAANWDPEVFDSPERLDVRRKTSKIPLNFGFGRHFCIGQALAMMELEEALRVALDLWAEFELAGEPDLPGPPFIITPQSVPLRFELA